MPPKTKSETDPDAVQPDPIEVDLLAEGVAALRVEVAELRARLDTMAPQSGNPARFRMSEGERLEQLQRERQRAGNPAAQLLGP